MSAAAKLRDQVRERAANDRAEDEVFAYAEHEPAPTPRRSYRMTEIGNAERLAAMHGHRLRYVRAWKSWLAWDGRRWGRDHLGAEVIAAKDVVSALFSEAGAAAQDAAAKAAAKAADATGEADAPDKRPAAILKWAYKSSTAGSVRSMATLAQSEDPIAATPAEFDRDAWVINLLNGTLELRTGLLRSHRQDDMITKLAPVAFDADATCPRWQTFLERVLPDAEVRTWMQRFLGYALTGSVTEHVLAFVYGAGANGKSTMIEVMMALLGDYARAAAPDLLLASQNDRHPTEIADLDGARLAVAQEIDEGRKWAIATIKRLTGGDKIKARGVGKDFYEFDPSHTFIIAANTKPRLDDQGNAVWRRVRLVPFDVIIPAPERDPELKAKLLEERAGILAWLVRGCLDWQRDGLGRAVAIDKATDEYKHDQDTIGTWLGERCVLMPGVFAPSKVLYEDFKAWLESHGRKPWTLEAWKARVTEREGIEDVRTATSRGLRGLVLRSDRSDAQ